MNYVSTGSIFASDDVACKVAFVGRRVDDYMRQRHDEIFGSDLVGKQGRNHEIG